jgi:hypothetical protein
MRAFRHTLRFLGALLIAAPAARAQAPPPPSPLRFTVTYDASVTADYTGRVYVMMSRRTSSPRFGPDWFNAEPFFAVDVAGWKPGEAISIDDAALAYPGPASRVPPGSYFIQAVMRRNLDSPQAGVGEGNGYSTSIKAELSGAASGEVQLHIDSIDGPRAFRESDRVRLATLRSRLLNEFHGRDVMMQAAVVLPGDPPGAAAVPGLPALYMIPGFGGDHHAVSMAFAGGGAPGSGPGARLCKIILNPLCRTGHHVFADSANNGPVGRALVEEFIPHLEREFGLLAAPTARFLTGVSSGGWASLWLQVTWPDTFGGVWSLVPDPVDFRDFQRINLYEPETAAGTNMYTDAAGAPRPIARFGEKPVLFYRPFCEMEVVLGEGGQIGSFDAVFSPRGPDGRPLPFFDRATGLVNHRVTAAWRNYDIRLVLEQHWPALGPKLAGKLNVFAGELDTFYLEGAVRLLKESLARLGSDAVVEILPGKDHMTVPDRDMWNRIDREVMAAFTRHHPGHVPDSTE